MKTYLKILAEVIAKSEFEPLAPGELISKEAAESAAPYLRAASRFENARSLRGECGHQRTDQQKARLFNGRNSRY